MSVLPVMFREVADGFVWFDRDKETYVYGTPGLPFDAMTMEDDADLLGLFADQLAFLSDEVSDCGRYRLVRLTATGLRVAS